MKGGGLRGHNMPRALPNGLTGVRVIGYVLVEDGIDAV